MHSLSVFDAARYLYSMYPAVLGMAQQGFRLTLLLFITAVPIIKLVARGEGDSGGHLLIY